VSWPSGYEEVYVNVAADRRLTITELDVVAVEDMAATAPPLRLGAPSPNPSGGRVRLDVSLPTAARVRLDVYDVQGRRVATLIDGRLGAGLHPVSWESRDHRGRRVAAGVYWARFEALGEVRTRAIVLAR
jgi:flagellar hook assembly protein FlgD